jgi:ribosomal protein S18 acetylase RimI-like enzyme
VVLIAEVTPDDWRLMRDIRLAALREVPSAFGSTYADEAEFTQARWRARITDRAATYLAYLADLTEPAGIGGVHVEDDGRAELVSMWVRPAARGRSVGEALVEAAAGWARAHDHDALYLWVTGSNDPARRLYERCGFTPTGESQPLPSNPAITEIRMRRDV